MSDSIALWAVGDGRLVRVSSRTVEREQQLENWIESNPDVLGQRLLLVGRQVRTAYGGVIDLLAVDDEGDKTPWRQRERKYIDHLAGCYDDSVYLVSVADKLHNLRSVLSDYEVACEDLWSRFNKGAGKTGVLQ